MSGEWEAWKRNREEVGGQEQSEKCWNAGDAGMVGVRKGRHGD